jgi:hypothetical protein
MRGGQGGDEEVRVPVFLPREVFSAKGGDVIPGTTN